MRGVSPEVLCQIQQLGEELELRTDKLQWQTDISDTCEEVTKTNVAPRPTTRERKFAKN